MIDHPKAVDVGALSTDRCPICEQKSYLFQEIEEYYIYRCGQCGHGFLFPLPSSVDLAASYQIPESHISNSGAFALLDTYREKPEEIRFYYRWRLNLCRSLLARLDKLNPSILDVACSCGVFLRCLQDIGFENVHGIDINQEAAQAGQAKLGVPIMVGDVESTTLGKFDLIMAFAIVEHVRDPLNLLCKFREMLNPGGFIIILIPNFGGLLRYVMRKRWLWYMPPFHLHHFTISSLSELVVKSGLKLFRLETLNEGTYLYLLYYFFFGAPDENLADGHRVSYGMVRRIDKMLRFFLAPITIPSKVFGKEPHILAVLRRK